MPPAAFSISRCLAAALALACHAYAGPSVLVDEDFSASRDSLWHLQAAAFTEGVFSPGLEADLHGRGFATGQLRVDAQASALRFIPRHGVKAHRSCFLGWRSDFRVEDVYASRVQVEVLGEVANPAAQDSLGGLYVLVRYEDEDGSAMLARTATDIQSPRLVSLDEEALIPIAKNDWIRSKPMLPDQRAQALSRIIGVGLCYISQSSAAFKSQSLLVGGFRARGELRWPRIAGSPESAEIMAGDSLALGWRFPPALAADFRWYRNEKPVPEERGRTLMFRPKPGDARMHVFRADVKLAGGEVLPTGEIRVRVLRPEPPSIGGQSGDTSVPEGGHAILRVKATGMAPLEYQWYRNGKPVASARQTFHSFLATSVSEGGRYHCEVTDRRGSTVKSRPVSLIVKPGPEKEGGLPQGLTAGPRLGLNVSDFYRDATGQGTAGFKLNFLQAGLGGVWQFRPGWAFQGEMLFTRKGVNYEFEDHSSVFALDYLECPLVLRARPGKWMPRPLSVFAGGYGALLVSATKVEDWGTWKGTETLEDLEALDYGAVLGLSWQMGILSLEWRYSLGLADIGTGAAGAGDPRMNGALSGMVGITLFSAQEAAR